MPYVARSFLAASCLASALVHLALVPGHADTPGLAAAFLTASALLVLSALLVVGGVAPRRTAVAAGGLLAALVAAYALDRMMGLPFAAAHAATHAHGGSGETSVDTLGLATKGVEVAGVLAALVLVRARAPRRFRLTPATERSDPSA